MNTKIVREIGNLKMQHREDKNWKQKEMYNLQRGYLLKYLKTWDNYMEQIFVGHDPLKICDQNITNAVLMNI